MVEKKVIEEVLTKSIAIHIKHGYFHGNLTRQLKEITDDDDEYKELIDVIWEFQEKYHDADVEHLKIKNIIGEEAEMTGDEESCWKTDEMIRIMNNHRVLYTIHNHPNTGCMLSGGDIYSLIDSCEKYSIALGEDGVMIIKNPYVSLDDGQKSKMEFISDFVDDVVVQWVKKDYKDIIDSYESQLMGDSLSPDEAMGIMKEATDFINSKIPRTLSKYDKDLSESLQNMFNGQKLDCEVYFIPKKKMG